MSFPSEKVRSDRSFSRLLEYWVPFAVGLIILAAILLLLRGVITWDNVLVAAIVGILSLLMSQANKRRDRNRPLAIICDSLRILFKNDPARFPGRAAAIETLLPSCEVLEPLGNLLSHLPENERLAYQDCIFSLVRPWLELLLTERNDDARIRTLIAGLFRLYAAEEHNLIGGTAFAVNGSKRHVIVTSFLAYSKFVDGLIKEALEQYKDEYLVCYTTLPMPLAKWFNFRARPGPWQYCETDPVWESYLKCMRWLTAEENSGQVSLRRCVLTLDDRLQQEMGSDFALRSISALQDYKQMQIAIPTDGKDEHDSRQIILNLRPLTQPELVALRSDESIGDIVRKYYKDAESAYLILPENKVPPHIAGLRWFRLADVFIELFHSSVSRDNSLYRIFRQRDIETWIKRMQMPEDLFLIGSRAKPSDRPVWHLCLAADVSRPIDRVAIEIVTKNLNRNRFGLIEQYVDWLFQDEDKNDPEGCGKLSDLLKQ
jgi:hypothetical protein